MLYVDDWDKIQERFKAFWENEIVDRCCISLVAPKKEAEYKEFDKTDLEKYWTDAEFVFERHEHYFKNTYYAGEAIPRIWVNLGPGITAAYLGCNVRFQETTVWFEPFVEDWEIDDYQFDENNKWWQVTKQLTRDLAALSKGKYLVSITDLSGVADIMAHLRGTEGLLCDMVDRPDQVKKVRDYIMKVVYKCYDELYNIAFDTTQGSVHWLNLWAPGKHLVLQCDLCTMISPKMFEEFILPEIQDQCRYYEYPVYHLDGPEEIKHLDMLLEIPELRAIQWVPLPGQGGMKEWMPLFKKIQKAGKGLYFALGEYYGTSYRDFEYVLQELSPRGLFIDTYCGSEDEAKSIIKNLEKWSCKKNRY